MIPGRLYLKIFLSFLLVLFITEILIFGLFLFSVGRHFRPRLENLTAAKVLMLKEVVENKIKAQPGSPPSRNPALIAFMRQFGDIMESKVWLSTPEGVVLVKAFSGDMPKSLEKILQENPRDFGHFKLYFAHSDHRRFYAVVPITLNPTEEGKLHIFFNGQGPSHPEKGFALGLLLIALIIALLVFPVSRLVTKRINRLRESALRIADGDLSHRAEVKGRDEIGELSRAFNRMAERLDRKIRGGRELTANVSHELRSPLARIRMAEELLRENIEKGRVEDSVRHLDNIREDIGELDHLIGRILDLSKLDIREPSLRFESLDLANLLDELLERFRPSFEAKNIRIRTAYSSPVHLVVDRKALGTALSNLLDNAAKYTRKKGDLIIGITPAGEDRTITLKNTCKPLAEEDLKNLFEPFYRPEHPSTGGSGLGLAITKRIIENHDGMIHASNWEEGLCFTIRLHSTPGVPGGG